MIVLLLVLYDSFGWSTWQWWTSAVKTHACSKLDDALPIVVFSIVFFGNCQTESRSACLERKETCERFQVRPRGFEATCEMLDPISREKRPRGSAQSRDKRVVRTVLNRSEYLYAALFLRTFFAMLVVVREPLLLVGSPRVSTFRVPCGIFLITRS